MKTRDADDLIMRLLDDETRRRLLRLADICHAAPSTIAASMLHDILKDDEDAHLLDDAEEDRGNIIDMRSYLH